MKKVSGVWKIAYADFITAMMILFLTLWIKESIPNEELKEIQQYFTNKATKKQRAHIPTSTQAMAQKKKINLESIKNEEKEVFANILETIQNSNIQQEHSENLDIYWDNGVIIEIMDSNNRPIFRENSSEMHQHSLPIMRKLSKILEHQNNYIAIDGHAISNTKSIDPWTLSFTRANNIRQYIEKYLSKDSIIKVTANGEKDLFDVQNKNNPKNARVTLTILKKDNLKNQYMSLPNEK